MKKEDALSLLVYVIMIAIAFVVGFVVIRPLFGNVGIGFALLYIIGAILFNVIIFEVAHIIGAKISGYKIMSFNILGLCLYRNDNKWKFKFANFDGITGETKIYPNKVDASPKAYALAPLFAYLLEVVLAMTAFYVLKTLDTTTNGLQALCIIFVTVGGMLGFYNIFPAKLDSKTDGYLLTLLSKKQNIKAYNELLRIEGAYANNVVLNDMLVFDEITDFTSSVNLYTIYKQLDEGKTQEANLLLDKIINNKDKISKDTYCSALAQKMFLVLMNENFDNAKKYYEEHVKQEERRYISNDLSMQSIRAYILISSMLDISEHETRYAISRVNKALKRTLPGRVEIEKKLYESALNKVDATRPEWHIKEKEIK